MNTYEEKELSVGFYISVIIFVGMVAITLLIFSVPNNTPIWELVGLCVLGAISGFMTVKEYKNSVTVMYPPEA